MSLFMSATVSASNAVLASRHTGHRVRQPGRQARADLQELHCQMSMGELLGWLFSRLIWPSMSKAHSRQWTIHAISGPRLPVFARGATEAPQLAHVLL
ncbi:hypothetical protein, partial [Terrabacter terrae]|uniref:hypothetical protein n=1 Tax=Terrabacter terrae TaxID=318434 RepID=UPI0031D0AE53